MPQVHPRHQHAWWACRRLQEEKEEEFTWNCIRGRRSLLPEVPGEARTTRCRVAPAQTNPRRREGDPRRLGMPHYDGGGVYSESYTRGGAIPKNPNEVGPARCRGRGEEEEEKEKFITSGTWRGKHNSLSHGAGSVRHRPTLDVERETLAA